MKKLLVLVNLIFLGFYANAQTPPTVRNDSVRVCTGAIDTIDVLANDIDLDGDSLYISNILINSVNGSLGRSNNKFVYQSDPGFRGTDFVYFRVCDNSTFNQCAFSIFIIRVDTCVVSTPINIAPIAGNEAAAICDSNSTLLYLLANDSDPDGDSVYLAAILDNPSNGTDSSGSGYYFYTNSGTAGVETIRYVVCDVPATLPSLCDTASIQITVRNCDTVPTPNRAPVAQVDAVIAIEDIGSITGFDPRSNDTDPDGDSLSWTPLFGPLQGTVVPFNNQWRYIPNPNVNGADAMPYQVCDNRTPRLCAFSVVTFVIAPVNDPPVANNDSITVPYNTRTPLPILQNDEDIDGDPLFVRRIFPASNGTVELINNVVYYTPNTDYLGEDAFRYQMCDSSNSCATANVYLNVIYFDFPPVAVADSTVINDVQATVVVDVLKNDYDVQNDLFTINSVTAGALVTPKIVERDGKQYIEIVKNNNTDCGMDQFSYTICGSGGCATAVVRVKVVCPFGTDLPQGFSPNGDGTNDLLIINNTADFQPVQLIVYNRWGHPVYESQEYLNDWDGKAQSLNQPLPDGTYFYTIRINDGRKYTNYLEIRR